MKVGEFLKGKGLVTGPQLDAALEVQLLYGGHLGTCLLELRAVDETKLGEALAEISGIPYAPPSVLKTISPKTIAMLPRKFAEKYRAIPIRADEGTLHLCLIDPRNISSLDEIAFVTGHHIKAWICPEVRIYQALDRYYGVRRSARYVALCRSLEISERMRELSEPAVPSHAKDPRAPADMAASDPASSPHDSAFPDLGGEYGLGRSWQDIAMDIGLDTPHAPGAPAIEAEPSLPARTDTELHPTLSAATDKLCRAENKQQAVDAILEFTSVRMERCIFFSVDNDSAAVRDSRGVDLAWLSRSNASFNVREESLFELLMGDDYYRGSLPDPRQYRSFYSVLGLEAPSEILLVPVHFDDHLVALFYGDGGNFGAVAGETEEYLRLFRVFSMAINQIVLKDSMRAIGTTPFTHQP